MIFSPLTYRILFLALLVSLGAFNTACRKVPKFSDVPNIQYKNIRKQTFYNAAQSSPTDSLFADSVIIGLHFEDGNGDLGYQDSDLSSAPVDFFVDVYRQTNGIFSPAIFQDSTLTYNGHIPLLAPVSSPGPIEGDLFYAMTFNYSTSQLHNDTLKFVVKLKDRAGNMSNSIETDPVIIRQGP
ncbi:MAG TPA: hypothetical protein VK750_03045 [Cytophagaceae bacterium]|jgi:hypothetical protein|nr:hypothetical protein [Cytophagaceae bacterium]